MLLSRGDRIVLVTEEIPAEDFTSCADETDGVVRALIGKFNFTKGKATLSGSDDDDFRGELRGRC